MSLIRRQRPWGVLATCILLSACGGDDDEPMSVADSGATDAGPPDASEPDSATPLDTGTPDADSGGCEQVTLSDWELSLSDDVSVGYEAFLNPSVGAAMRFGLLFERYAIGADTGSFDFSEGADSNFGGCAHCPHAWIDLEHAFYADRGTLEVHEDPYSFVLNIEMTNVRLVESDIDPLTRSSTPIDGGRCIEIADTVVDQTFGPPTWTCPVEQYSDGTACHCGCGTFDPDCGSGECPPFDPGCVPRDPLPIANCDAGEICAFEPISMDTECRATCEWGTLGCDAGAVCVASFGVQPEDTCETQQMILDEAIFGQPCQSGGLQKVCNIVDGVALGFCDFGNVCKPICNDDSECTAPDETCQFFLGPEGRGFCGGIPPDDG